MKYLILIVTFFAFTLAANAQTVDAEPQCPADRVCLTREQAIEYLSYRDQVNALKAELEVNARAIADLQKLINDTKVNLARIAGEKSQLEADRVRTNAIMDILIRNSRAKKIGLINF